MRKVLIEKIGNATNVTAWDTKIPDKKVIKSYSQGANTLIENDVLIIEDSNDIFPKQRILFSELDENYGTTDIKSFGIYLNENGFFLVSGGSWGDITGTLSEQTDLQQALDEINSTLNPDRIISLGTETIDGNEHTYEDYTWQLEGVQVNNIGNPSIIVIPSATVGFKRKDISVFTPTGTIERVAGTETDGEVVTSPDVPEGTLYYKSYDIDGDTIEVAPEPPAIDGSIFKKKIENTRYKSKLSGENVIIPFQATGQSHYSVTHAALVSVAGFTTAGLTTPMYEGQDVIFENQTGHDITLKDSFGVDTSFVIGDDLIVPNEGKIWFRFRNNELELIDKNWFGIKEVVNPENLGEFIDGLDSKTNIKDDDKFIISDSEDLLKSKKTRFLDLKTKLKSYFDTFYLSLSVFNDFVEDVFDSLDNKQDKLTETNFGQFMDVDLATKLTPSVNDTFVGRDSLTNEAVEFNYPIVEGYFNGTNFYLEAGFVNMITATTGRTYIDLARNSQYRWSGSAYVQIGGYIEKNSNLNVTITGTTVETLLYTKNIGVITTNNLLKIEDLLISQEYIGIVNTSGNIILRIRISDSPTLPTDINSIIATLNIPSNINSFDAFAKMERTFTFTPFSEAQYTIICPPPNISFNTDIINTFSYKWNMIGQLANNKYLFITAELPFATNNCTLRSLIIQKI